MGREESVGGARAALSTAGAPRLAWLQPVHGLDQPPQNQASVEVKLVADTRLRPYQKNITPA